MNYLFTLSDKNIFHKPRFSERSIYDKRLTVKAISINSRGEFGFVTNPIHGLCLLAGGGTESGNLEKEIERECKEELNVQIKIKRKIGTALEYRSRDSKEYETTCFLVEVIGTIQDDMRTEEEKTNGLRAVWLTEKEAFKILKEQEEKVQRGEVVFYNTAFNAVRDYKFFIEYIRTKKVP